MKLQACVTAALASVLVGGCAKAIVKPPKEQLAKVGSLTATYRDWSKTTDLCLVDAKVVQADFDSTTHLFAEFLGQTSAGPEGMWADEHVALLEQGQAELPAVVKVTKRSVAAARKAQCKFNGLNKVNELAGQAEKRLEEAPDLLAQVKARKALAQWKAQLIPAMDTAKQRCEQPPPAKGKAPPPPKADLYYAFEDEKGQTEWLFCDGAKVVASTGQPPAHVPGPEVAPVKGKKPVKLSSPQEYLDAAAKRSSADIDRAPKLPSKIAKKADDGQPAPADPK